MIKSENLHCRISSQTKKDIEEICLFLGISKTDFINSLVRDSKLNMHCTILCKDCKEGDICKKNEKNNFKMLLEDILIKDNLILDDVKIPCILRYSYRNKMYKDKVFYTTYDDVNKAIAFINWRKYWLSNWSLEYVEN